MGNVSLCYSTVASFGSAVHEQQYTRTLGPALSIVDLLESHLPAIYFKAARMLAPMLEFVMATDHTLRSREDRCGFAALREFVHIHKSFLETIGGKYKERYQLLDSLDVVGGAPLGGGSRWTSWGEPRMVSLDQVDFTVLLQERGHRRTSRLYIFRSL